MFDVWLYFLNHYAKYEVDLWLEKPYVVTLHFFEDCVHYAQIIYLALGVLLLKHVNLIIQLLPLKVKLISLTY